MNNDIASISISKRPVALVPAYKPDQKLIETVKNLKKFPEIQSSYCLDDGSGNSYSHIFNELISLGVQVISHKVNLGKGMALRTGFNVIACEHPNALGIITFDADGQHLSKDISKVAKRLIFKNNSLILGVRDIPKDAPLRSRFGNSLTKFTVQFFTGMKLKDTQTGLRGIPAELIPSLLRLKTTGYDFELDMLLCAKQHKMEIQEVPVETIYLNKNESSHFNPILDSIKIYFLFFKFSSISIITAIIDYTVFSILILSTNNLLLSLVICRLVAASFQFISSHSFVFKEKGQWLSSALRYIVVLVSLSTVSYWGMYTAKKYLGIPPIISKLLIEGTIFLLSFLLQRDFVFSGKKSQKNSI